MTLRNQFGSLAACAACTLLALSACGTEGGTPGGASGGAANGGSAGSPRGSGGASGSNAGSGAGGAAGTGGTAGASGNAASGAGGGAGSAGRAGSAGSAGRGPSDGGTYDANRDPNAPGILIHVRNDCPFEIWIHGAGNGGVLTPDNARLATGQTQDYIAPDSWSAARVTAFGQGPNAQGRLQQELDKVEMTLGKKIINYNITYVDWLGLPAEMVALGSGSDCKRVGCYLPVADVSTRCPNTLLSGKRCLSAGNYCSQSAHAAEQFCHALDDEIAECAASHPDCAGAAGASTPQVYGCSGFFGSSPKWCAALNRGMLDDPENGDITRYYENAPYNTYSEWVHDVCPGIYAFPYDDYGKTNESGFHACTGGRQLNITFCPAG
ncbi:MAG TPA: beta-1,3-glucanase family protein [Polyangiaceae bacterium]|nr:beta-1,3-glucanase family protein [Polyangiaceae bacterium]